ncbi:DNA-binding protein [Thalassospira sp. MBR-102]|uniref:DNA-binding protein n=1 Tax=Thalassospira sp. MBR-102 TaxID=3156466 RepID=UPI0033945835
MARIAHYTKGMIQAQVQAMLENGETVNVSRVRAHLGGGSHQRIQDVIHELCGKSSNENSGLTDQSPDRVAQKAASHLVEALIDVLKHTIAYEACKAKNDIGNQVTDLLKALPMEDSKSTADSPLSNEKIQASDLYHSERRKREAAEAVARELKSELAKRDLFMEALRADVRRLTNDLIQAHADVTSLRLRAEEKKN